MERGWTLAALALLIAGCGGAALPPPTSPLSAEAESAPLPELGASFVDAPVPEEEETAGHGHGHGAHGGHGHAH